MEEKSLSILLGFLLISFGMFFFYLSLMIGNILFVLISFYISTFSLIIGGLNIMEGLYQDIK